nr:hypothetical protein CFP56_66666 [Quercus suber]
MQITNFEERLRDIDEAIGFGEKNTGLDTALKEKTNFKAGSQDILKHALSQGEDNMLLETFEAKEKRKKRLTMVEVSQLMENNKKPKVENEV